MFGKKDTETEYNPKREVDYQEYPVKIVVIYKILLTIHMKRSPYLVLQFCFLNFVLFCFDSMASERTPLSSLEYNPYKLFLHMCI